MDEITSAEDLKKFEDIYIREASNGEVTANTQFNYAYCLVRSNSKNNIVKGASLLQGLCHSGTDQRDYLYFLGEANYKLHEYKTALKYVNRVLQIEPQNRQALELQDKIQSQMQKDGLLGLGILGGTAFILGGAAVLVGLFAASKSK
ncbi:predicted protein [Nematostella vectensis]|uniref:Mitochondrial fission 1 protein n=1 Tax=Nematostella vectensis TaxID=45351 RepID=A7SM21_NEMVE|nr:mitochondrial fission 1 protein [Nematostella vectensis]EDO35234.1 predicted protein [Nematostella vectensis]|eukprot:XP_001627334.1 predicted protein [Nematostella vectensis]